MKWTFCIALLAVQTVWAQESDSSEAQAANAFWQQIMAQSIVGPSQIQLSNQGILQLPADYKFLPAEPTAQLMEAWGNSVDDSTLGLVMPVDEESGDWFALIDYIESGYIKDDDAKDWDVDALLQSVKEGTDAQNAQRIEMGIPEIEIVGWVQKPTYTAGTHQLVYSMSSRDKGSPADAAQGINYNTYVLGREGYLQLNLVTELAAFDADRRHADKLLSAMQFSDGKLYAQFNADTDHVAEYGLAALVAGVAAKKLGFLAVIGLFLVKAWKLVLVGIFAVGALAKKMLGGKAEK